MSIDLIEELFHEAIQCTPDRRDRALATAQCSEEVRDSVRQLIHAYEQSSNLLNDDLVSDLQKISPGFLDTHPSHSVVDTVNDVFRSDDIVLKRGQRIDKYVVEEVIGTGGMSVVYRAIQTQPVKRRVAIKLIRPSNTTKVALQRFFREQQAVAILRHPNIASLYEVTSMADGKPAAVMEYVRGRSIIDFCDRHRLNWKHRIGVFLKVCRGLSHAHQRGVVHRDIKPENILVAVEDRKPAPKLIDFGIATIKRADFDNPVLTQTGHMIGTPRYMSPEQFANSANLDHRTDIYSAALVLFELLAGVPFLEGATANELSAYSNNAEQERLSARIRKVAATGGKGHFHGQSTEELARFASKDLDWILVKALARNPRERYDDIATFANDLRGAVLGNPVSVSAPTFLIRSRKFLLRHHRKFWIGTSLGIICLLSCGLYQKWNSEAELQEARREQTKQVEKTAAANDLIMTLLASDEYQLTSDQFDLDLAPAYRSHYQQIQDEGGPKCKEDRFVYGILAVMEAMIGDFDQAETLMETADAEHGNEELRVVRNKICEKYAAAAKVRLGELDTKQGSFEKAAQQTTLARCYFVWGMYGDGEQLLTDAIEFYESERPRCYESLVARLALIKILQRAGKEHEMKTCLAETLQRFCDHKLLINERGQFAWSAVKRLAKEHNVESPG